ncbi:hypothetical protein Droror1_Dr00018603 [Drosera rotundifolia]
MAAMASDSAPTEDQMNQIEQHFNIILNEDDDAYLESTSTRGEQDDHDDDDDEDFEFEFVCEQSKSPIAADDIFEDGQIRPLFHFVLHDSSDHHETTSSSSPIRKVFIERTDRSEETAAEGPACAWLDKSNVNVEETSSAPEICKKSNSTGFSKMFRFRDMLLRSYSDGRDAFVFLANHKRVDKHETTTTTATTTTTIAATTTTTMASSQKEKVSTKERKTSSVPGKGKKKTASNVMQYGRKKTGEAARRKSYLPYRQDLVGFFTSVNGMSRNVHPY